MDPLIISVLVMTAIAQVSATTCNLNQKNGTHQCYGALGENLFLRLAEHGSNKSVALKKASVRILQFLGTGETWRSKLSKEYVNRSIFVNGTFVLNGVMKNDSGDYEIEIFHSDGKLFYKFNMQLEIQAPVSEPVLSRFCFSNRESIATCVSEGDDLQFTWAMNHEILISNVAYNAVNLKSNDIGKLTCIVQNKVSSHNSTIGLSACQVVSSQFPFLVVTLAVVLTVAALTVMFNYLRKKYRSRCDTSESCNNADIVYADVKIHKPRKQTKKPPSATEMVEYGQIEMAVNPVQRASP